MGTSTAVNLMSLQPSSSAKRCLIHPTPQETDYNTSMNNTTVCIVFKEVPSNTSGNEFVGVFFDRKSAQDWIAGCDKPNKYFIETYEKPESGIAHEVFA